MRKMLFLILISAMLILLIPGCKNSVAITSEQEAKDALIENTPEAIILNCTYQEDTKTYQIEYQTEYDTYIAFLDSVSGKITISPKSVLETEDPTLFPEDNVNKEPQLTISSDDAYVLAVADAGSTAMVNRSQEDYIKSTNTYYVSFYSVDYEYSYIISAETGEVLQQTKANIETGEILEYRKRYSETGEILHYKKNISDDGTVTETVNLYANHNEYLLENANSVSSDEVSEDVLTENALPTEEPPMFE